MTADQSVINRIIDQLDLQPHPEGGFYRQTYSCDEHITRSSRTHAAIERRASTGIYYMLSGDAYSAWHRIDSDEMWHFYAGDPLLIHVLYQHGEWLTHRLGNMLEQPDAVFQAVVPAGCWFAAERHGSEGFSLVGCTVAPGFEFETFELANVGDLLRRYPAHESVILRLAPGRDTGRTISGR
jgi:uncharacterized protein